jgi:hypothetical protein
MRLRLHLHLHLHEMIILEHTRLCVHDLNDNDLRPPPPLLDFQEQRKVKNPI